MSEARNGRAAFQALGPRCAAQKPKSKPRHGVASGLTGSEGRWLSLLLTIRATRDQKSSITTALTL